MKYQIYFLQKEFKDVIDENILKEILSEKDDFALRQIKYFVRNIEKKEILELLKNKFNGREDIIIDEDIVIYKNQLTGKAAKLFFDDNLILLCDDKKNPLLNELRNGYPLLLLPLE